MEKQPEGFELSGCFASYRATFLLYLLLNKTNAPPMTYQEGDLLRQPDGSVFQLFDLEYTSFVYIEKGSFRIGDNISSEADEKEATIDFKEDYFVAQHAVTQELYERVMGVNPATFKHKHRPVESVSWNEICEEGGFLNSLNQYIKRQYPFLKGTFGLPSEAQWEYAARGGKVWNDLKMTYAGSQEIEDVAWYDGNSNEKTMPVGLKQSNALGLYDMSGNVWEWCADKYTDSYSKNPKDGSAYLQKGTLRGLRGGSYFYRPDYCRLAFRNRDSPNYRNTISGFRLVFIDFVL
jgi:formylglycine-generating enzyme required for sulfatase activity